MGKELKRMNYLTDLLLESKDYNQDKEYQRRIKGLHNRHFHTWGIISGLDVKPVTDSNMEVYVTEGAAIDLTTEGLDGTNIKESISRQILIYEGHPDNPIDLSEYTASDNIYIFARSFECNADREYERGQGEEIRVWECGSLSFAKEKPEDDKNNIILARIVPKEVVTKSMDISYTETVIDSTCIYYTDIDGSELRVYAGIQAKELALKKFIFRLNEEIKGRPFITANLEKSKVNANKSEEQSSYKETEVVISENDALTSLETIKTGLYKCIEKVITSDQKLLSNVLQTEKLDYLVNMASCKQLDCLLKIVLSDLLSLINKKYFTNEYNKSIADFENIVINTEKIDKKELTNQLNQFSADFEKLICSENSTDNDAVVASLELVRADIDNCIESLSDMNTEKLTSILEAIKADLIGLKDSVDETEQKNGRLKISTNKLNDFASALRALSESIETMKTALASASKLTDNAAMTEINNSISQLNYSLGSIVTPDQSLLIEKLKAITADLESFKNDIGQTKNKDGLKKLEDGLLNLVNSSFSNEEIEDELKKITFAFEDLKISIISNDQEEILCNIELIAYGLRKCTDNAVTIYQKELAAVLNLIKEDILALEPNKTEFSSKVNKVIARLQNLPYSQKENYMTILDQIINSLRADILAEPEKTKSDLSSLIDNVNSNIQDILNLAISDAVTTLNDIQADGQKNGENSIDNLINLLNMLNTDHQQSVICLMKKSMSDLANLVIDEDIADYDENMTGLFDKIRSDLEESKKNAVSIDQRKFYNELEKFRTSSVQLKESNQAEFTNKIKVINEILKNIIKIPEVKVIDETDIAYLENRLDIINVFSAGKDIKDKLIKIGSDLEDCIINNDDDRKSLSNSMESLNLSDNLLYIKDKIDKAEVIDSIVKVSECFEKCTETAIIIDQKQYSAVLRKFKHDLVYFRNSSEGIEDSLRIMSAGLLSFINTVGSAGENGLVYILQKNLTELENLINTIAAEEFSEKFMDKLEVIKSDINIHVQDVIVANKEKLISVLEKLKVNFVNIGYKAGHKELMDYIKGFSADLVNFVIDINAAGGGSAVTVKKNLSGLIKLINNIKMGDTGKEKLCKMCRIRQDLLGCTKSIITSEQNRLIDEIGAFKASLEKFNKNITTTEKNELLDVINETIDFTLKFINDEGTTGKESLTDEMRIVITELVSLKNNLDITEEDDELQNKLMVNAINVNFTGNVTVEEDLIFKQLSALKKNGQIESEVKFTEKFLQLNSKNNSNELGWKIRDGGIDVFRGGPGVAPDARIMWSDAENIWKAGFENKLSRILYGEGWGGLTEGDFNDGLHMHGKLSSKKGTVLSVNDEGRLSSQIDLVINDKSIGVNNGKIEWYGHGKLFGEIEVNGPVLEVSKQGILGTTSNGERTVLYWNKNGKVGLGQADFGLADDLDIAGSGRLLIGSNPIRITSEWTAFPDLTVNQAEISNDTTYYKALMIVGNQSAGQGRKVTISDVLEVNGLLNVNGYTQTIENLIASTGAGNNGIIFPSDPGGGSGDAAWVKYYPRVGENYTLEIGTSNDGDDNILLVSSGNVGVGTLSPNDELDVNGYMRMLSGTNPIRFTDSWSGFTSGSPVNAEISNDTGTNKALMLVGNRSGGNQRIVSVWDDLDINGPLEIKGNGNLQVIGAIVPGVGNCEVKGIMFQKDPGGGSGDAAWIRYYSDESRGGGENMTLEIGVSNDSNVQTDNITEWISTCPYGITNGCGYWRSYTRTYIGNGGDRLRFRTSDGGTYIDGNFYLVSSKEYKENINNVSKTEVRRIIDELEPVEFNFKRDKSRTTLGFIAESMPKKLTNSDKKAISPMEIMTVLVGEVKEQEKEIIDLRKKVAKLKRRKK